MAVKQTYHVQLHNEEGNVLATEQYEYTYFSNFKHFQLTRENSHLKRLIASYDDAHSLKVFEQASHGDSWYLLENIKVGEL